MWTYTPSQPIDKQKKTCDDQYPAILSEQARSITKRCTVIEGLHAKRAYIKFWPIFIFCRIELIFGRLTCFDMKSIVSQLFWSICASFSRNNICKKTQFCMKRHLNERIFRRQILTRHELKRLLLAALTACFL